MLDALKMANLALAFALELCLIVALGYWGFHTGSGVIIHVALGVGAPLLAVVFWGLVMAPRAPVKLPTVVHWALFVVVFGLGALALVTAGHSTLGLLLFVSAIASKAFATLWPPAGSFTRTP